MMPKQTVTIKPQLESSQAPWHGGNINPLKFQENEIFNDILKNKGN